MRSVLPALLIISLISCNSDSESKSETLNALKDSITVDSSQNTSSFTHDNCEVLHKKAKQMDSTIMKQMDLDINLGRNAIKAFTDFAFYCESDSVSPVFLIKSAQIATAINNPTQAQKVLERCISNYPNFKNKPAAMFLLAQLYDEQTQLNDENEARKIYNDIINDYPKSEWASNAKAALALIGKTDVQIMNELKNKK